MFHFFNDDPPAGGPAELEDPKKSPAMNPESVPHCGRENFDGRSLSVPTSTMAPV